MRVVDTPLTGGPLTQAALNRRVPSDWYAPAPATREDWVERCAQTRRQDSRWFRDIAPALGSGASLVERAAADGVVVTTGQQPGLFGGPLYTWFKALSALELAAAIERETGVAATPVFWAATDDADFIEAATTAVPTADEPKRLTLEAPAHDSVPLSATVIGAEIRALYDQLHAASGSAADPRALRAARHFSAGATVGAAYVAMLRELLEPLGVAVLDASHAAVQGCARPLLESALARAGSIDVALTARQREIEQAGFDAQVGVDRALSLVFEWTHGPDGLPRKRRIPVEAAAAAPDSMLSANVLLRPVVERAILPTVAYLAGPAEIAYFAQVSAVAGALDVPAPLVLPRWSGVLIPEQTTASLAQLGVDVDDLRADHIAERRLAAARTNADAEAAITALRASIVRELARLGDALPATALDGAREQFERRVIRLERRVLAATKRREAGALGAIAAARGVLFPFGKPQERVLNVVPLWSRFGDAFVDGVRARCRVHASRMVAGTPVPA